MQGVNRLQPQAHTIRKDKEPYDAYLKKEAEAQELLLGKINASLRMLVLNCNTAKEIWDLLNVSYSKKSALTKTALLRRLQTVAYDGS
jgi:hypothetical protein